MKKTFLAFATLFLFMAINAQAQQEFVWDHYKMSIELPDDFKVINNTNNEFECDGVGMHLYMYVYDILFRSFFQFISR
jgi:predicted phosphatase